MDKKSYLKKQLGGKGGPGLFGSVMDKITGTTRYNSADNPGSAPEMVRRSIKNQGQTPPPGKYDLSTLK